MTQIDLLNSEKTLQSMFNLRERPTLFRNIENAKSYVLRNYKLAVMEVSENPANIIPGYYVMLNADAQKVERESDGNIQLVKTW